MNELPGLYFILGTDTSGTEFEPLRLSANGNGGALNIGHKPAVGMHLGMAYVLAKLDCFTTQVALQLKYSFDI